MWPLGTRPTHPRRRLSAADAILNALGVLPVDKRGWMNYVTSALEKVWVNKTKLSREMHRIQRRPNRSRLRIGASLLIASFALLPVRADAFVAAGDRVFQGTLILPQIAPTDETYIQGATPFSGTTPIPLNTRRTDVIGFFGKTLTEHLGIRVKDVYTRLDPVGGSSLYGWQTLTATAQYMAVLDGPHEFLFSVGVDRPRWCLPARALAGNCRTPCQSQNRPCTELNGWR